jgi:hypothetical protein
MFEADARNSPIKIAMIQIPFAEFLSNTGLLNDHTGLLHSEHGREEGDDFLLIVDRCRMLGAYLFRAGMLGSCAGSLLISSTILKSKTRSSGTSAVTFACRLR